MEFVRPLKIKMGCMLLSLFIASLMILISSSTTFAQDSNGFNRIKVDKNLEFFDFSKKDTIYGAKVISINRNLVFCRHDLVLDISTAKLSRPIEVGDTFIGVGTFTPNGIYPSLLKVESGSSFYKSRDVEFDGQIQSLNGNELMVLNQKVTLTPNTFYLGKNNLRVGIKAFVYAEMTSNGYVATEVLVPSFQDDFQFGIVASISSIRSLVLSLFGGYTTTISEENLRFLAETNVGVGSPVFVNLRDNPGTKKLVSPFVGIIINGLNFSGKINNVDANAKIITVLGKQVNILPNTDVIDNQGNFITLEEIDPNNFERALVIFDPFSDDLLPQAVILFRKTS